MKKLFLLILLFPPILSFSQDITSGLVGYWPFNGNANDESGNGNDGVVNGATLTEDRFGNANSAYSFDGVDDYIVISKENSFDFEKTDGFSISAWIKPNSVDRTDIFGKQKQSPDYNGFAIRIDPDVNGGGELGVLLQHDSSPLDRIAVESASSIPINIWTHVVITYDGSSTASGISLFMNGSEEANIIVHDVLTGSILNDILPNIGAGGGNGPANSLAFDGLIDDINVFSRALNQNEILELYNSNGSTPLPELCQNVFCDGQNVGIGIPNAHGYKLAVAGNILTEEIKVATQAYWPDYVFEEDYPLADLTELEGYIRKNKHLPEIPNAHAIKDEGYNLSEMDAKLLEKIEELTLYVIEQEKNNRMLLEKIEDLKKENMEQNTEIEKLKSK